MGRGRAKAKQTKVARHLKYDTPDMDVARLQAELSRESISSHSSHEPAGESDSPDSDLYEDRWAEELEDDGDDGDPAYAKV